MLKNAVVVVVVLEKRLLKVVVGYYVVTFLRHSLWCWRLSQSYYPLRVLIYVFIHLHSKSLSFLSFGSPCCSAPAAERKSVSNSERRLPGELLRCLPERGGR